jgi:NAD(P)-dependent dehydrogenase (short-subunit alcohol dehydrogenase family)
MTSSDSSPPDRIALVTGAGSGIGRAVAEALLVAGWQVVFTGRRLAALQATVAALDAPLAAGATALASDVTDPASVAALFGAVQARFGRLDLLFNNAGVFTRAVPIEDMPFADWRASIDTNLTGAFLCTQQAFRLMKAQTPRGGRIINNGSLSAHVPRPWSAGYTASKHGMTGLTKSAALDGRPHDIAVGQIDIGNALTDMTHAMAQGMRQADGSMRAEAVMDVRHVADAVVHMAGLPLEANVQFMTVMATQMPFIGRG